jgi:hypothetical protein
VKPDLARTRCWPYGTEPQFPVSPGYVNRNHDERVTTNGEVDMPF